MSTAWIGAEMANYFPHVSFNGSMALESKTFSGMSEPQADAYSFGPRITWTAFDMGRIKARVDAAKADTKAQLAGYEKTVLAALAETDGALIAYGHDQARRKSIQTAVDAARKARDIARQRQKEGMADKMAVLELDRHLLETQSALCEAQTAENTRVVAIYKSLGGGWEASPLPTEKR
jgi:multidrug efflux system outer membrane protein